MSTLKFLVTAFLMVSTVSSRAAMVRAEAGCPHSKLESCRWEIETHVDKKRERPTILIEWWKGIASRHREKPMAKPLTCNVDRDFNHEGGGYIHVWFKGEAEACDPTKQPPAECGVTFLLDDPRDFHSARGFRVTAPEGKTLVRVEHYSTLNLQCGDFRQSAFRRFKWNAKIGWKSDHPGDGTYAENSAPQIDQR